MMTKLQILLLDDHQVVREGLKALINAQPDMAVIGEADNGQAAVQQALDCNPDVVIMDTSMQTQAREHLQARHQD
jgi:DNA-binding NarL/FixJ family response regulator